MTSNETPDTYTVYTVCLSVCLSHRFTNVNAFMINGRFPMRPVYVSVLLFDGRHTYLLYIAILRG